jgi:hypothetical protein
MKKRKDRYILAMVHRNSKRVPDIAHTELHRVLDSRWHPACYLGSSSFGFQPADLLSRIGFSPILPNRFDGSALEWVKHGCMPPGL